MTSSKSVARIVADLKGRGLLSLAVRAAQKYHVPLDHVLGRRRTAPVVQARHELWVFVYELVPSTTVVGEIFDRDHTTILVGMRQHCDREAVRTAVEVAPDPYYEAER